MKAKSIELPNQVIVIWGLDNLTSPYKGFVIIITQSYRTNSSTINLENLFFNLLNKFRRQVFGTYLCLFLVHTHAPKLGLVLA